MSADLFRAIVNADATKQYLAIPLKAWPKYFDRSTGQQVSVVNYGNAMPVSEDFATEAIFRAFGAQIPSDTERLECVVAKLKDLRVMVVPEVNEPTLKYRTDQNDSRYVYTCAHYGSEGLIELIKFTAEPEGKSSYRALTSLNAFRCRGAGAKRPGHQYSIKFRIDILIDLRHYPALLEPYLTAKRFESIWEFYNYIGYDWKKKKWAP